MLLVDIGNSRIKAAYVSAGALCERPFSRGIDAVAIDAWMSTLPPIDDGARVLVANVAGPDVAHAFSKRMLAIWNVEPEFAAVCKSAAGVTTRYDDPASLGVDRWLAAVGAFHLAGGAVCAVDAGTALTVDVVTANGTHVGGMIAPGLDLMKHSLTSSTALLTLDQVVAVDHFADNSADAISLGCAEAVRGMLQRTAARLAAEFPGMTFAWYLTGGDADRIKSVCDRVFEHVPDLVLRGLALVADTDR